MLTLTKAQIKHFSGLLRPGPRAEARQLLAHGRKVVEVALASGAAVECLIVTEAYLSAHPEVARFGPELALVAPHELAKLSDQPAPEGLMAVVGTPQHRPPDALTGPALIGWQLNDPGNVGALLRIAGWYGLQGVWLSPGSADPFGPKAVRGSMGACFQVACGLVADLELRIAQQAQRVALAAAAAPTLAQRPLAPEALRAAGRDLIVLGSESHGLPQQLLQLPGVALVSIPARGLHPPESLNVAVAAGILTHALLGRP
jgi:TrmH family RNA methyltransferase